MSFDSLSATRLRPLDVNQTSRDKPRVDGPQPSDTGASSSSQVAIIRSGNEESLKKAETFRRQSQSSSHNSSYNFEAIATYESIEKEQQRQNIQMLLGVDTFA